MTELAAGQGHLSDGTQVALFEREFCDVTGARHAVAVTNCTMALELASRVLGFGAGDEVISSALTFQATVSSFVGSHVDVRFADVDPDTLCLDPDSVERLIGPRTRAIYTVHYGGLCGGVGRLRELADANGLVLVEDCAHAIGAAADGRSAGTWGDIGCWSFHSLKNISTLGQGGMLTVGTEALAERLRRLRCIEPDASFTRLRGERSFGSHATPTDPRRVTHEKNAYTHDCVQIRASGLNAQMSEPAAAVGRSQLRRLDHLIARREELAGILDARLATIPGVRTLPVPAGYRHARHLYAFRLVDPTVRRDDLVSLLVDRGIEVVLRYFPLHLLPEWRLRGARLGDVPVTERVWFEELVNLPISPQLHADDMHYMADAVAWAMTELTARVPRVVS
ncbi:MAG TPA: DegT/DnrJ/EryC1/StrS family aminotransferase [Candidatus Dormibacteraeota bacterium]|nr:DegT/DnrJ/EryC1/StrS family aminotransferase [Candidatus Dormibacteraeota bacterium]